jgi:mannose-6-phosphate isomerase-like protein (cupin superfamily)
MPTVFVRTFPGAALRRGAVALFALTAAIATSHAASSPGLHATRAVGQQPPTAARTRGGYVLERDSDVAKEEPGTHKGGGQTIGYSFFKDTPNLAMVFRKRALKPGSAIGYHEQKKDEIYYVLSGRGLMTIDGKEMAIGPGTAVLTRPGSSHGLKQVGSEDLVIMINYLQQPAR